MNTFHTPPQRILPLMKFRGLPPPVGKPSTPVIPEAAKPGPLFFWPWPPGVCFLPFCEKNIGPPGSPVFPPPPWPKPPWDRFGGVPFSAPGAFWGLTHASFKSDCERPDFCYRGSPRSQKVNIVPRPKPPETGFPQFFFIPPKIPFLVLANGSKSLGTTFAFNRFSKDQQPVFFSPRS